MIVFTKMPDDQEIPGAGEWGMITIHSNPPRQDVAIGCPECGCHARLQHTIDDAGIVKPSLVCPFDDCSFHDWGKLKDWAA